MRQSERERERERDSERQTERERERVSKSDHVLSMEGCRTR